MNLLARRLLDLVLLRAGPQDLPYSVALARALVVLSIAMDLVFAGLLGVTERLLPRIGLSLLLLLGAPWLLLAWRGLRPRYAQTLAALAGTAVVFKLLMLPLALAISGRPLPQEPTELEPMQVLVGWLTLALLAWRLLVSAHIWRHALDLRLGLALLVALGLAAVELVLAQLLLVAG